MKKYWLYVVALLLPIFTLAQSLPTYTLIGENTVCGGNIKVDWSAAVAASIPVTQWKAELYDSNGRHNRTSIVQGKRNLPIILLIPIK